MDLLNQFEYITVMRIRSRTLSLPVVNILGKFCFGPSCLSLDDVDVHLARYVGGRLVGAIVSAHSECRSFESCVGQGCGGRGAN